MLEIYSKFNSNLCWKNKRIKCGNRHADKFLGVFVNRLFSPLKFINSCVFWFNAHFVFLGSIFVRLFRSNFYKSKLAARKQTKMSEAPNSPILNKFLCCFKHRTGGYLMGIIDCLLYAVLCGLFTLQIFSDFKLIDKKYGRKCFGSFVQL